MPAEEIKAGWIAGLRQMWWGAVAQMILIAFNAYAYFGDRGMVHVAVGTANVIFIAMLAWAGKMQLETRRYWQEQRKQVNETLDRLREDIRADQR